MEIILELQTKEGISALSFTYDRMVNAGYTGKNQDEVRKHIEELAAKGIPGPASTPTLYPVICNTLTTEPAVEVYSEKTSGEAEYALLVVNENEVYVGIGSDHTDRHLEETDIPRAKQICPNILSKTVWPLDELSNHWDELIMKSKVSKDGEEIRYQEGPLGALMNPSELMTFVKTKIPGPLEGIIIFSGTLGMLTGDFVFADRFSSQLIDEKMGRRLEASYKVQPLSYMEVE